MRFIDIVNLFSDCYNKAYHKRNHFCEERCTDKEVNEKTNM